MRNCLIAILAALSAVVTAAETIDRVLAVVAGQLIMLSDVRAAQDLGTVEVPAGSDPVGAVLGKLIDRELMLAEVDRYAPPEPETTDIDREVSALRARFQSAKAFEDVLARSGFDITHIREMERQNLRLRAYLDQRFTLTDSDPQRRQTQIDEWIAGLRRRMPVLNLYKP